MFPMVRRAVGRRLLAALRMVEIGGREIAVQAARNYHLLRGHGVAVRKRIDTRIATRCMESGFELSHSDRGFDAFAAYLGLRVVESRV
jgi:hypothetical protein